MSELKYRICLESGESFEGCAKAEGLARIAVQLPEGRIKSVTAQLPIDLAADGKIFMNGYQTWTYCPEYDKNGSTKGVSSLPKFVKDYFGIDRYGDYHFVDYPRAPGVTHGESYCYFREGDKYRLIASLDERAGYTLFRFDSRSEVLTVERDCAGMRCGGELSAFELIFAEGGEDEVFDAWFAAMGTKPRTSARLAGYSSWYNRYQNIDEMSIYADLDGCAQVLKSGDLFQIDDGWESAVGDWLDCDRKKFPQGMRAAADAIHQKNLKAGLWLAPFVCQKSAKIRREHPDWLLKHNGKNWYCGSNWGGFWSLDIDNPEVVDYLERVFDRVLNDWGFDLVKLDFLYGAAPFGTENESRAARMTRGMELLRRVCADKLILGCGVPLAPAFGLVDYCRISCDVGPDWDNSLIMRHTNRERVSTRQAIGNSIFRRQLNGRAFMSDPDVFYLRDDKLKLTEEQKHILATVNSLFGGILLCSDNMAQYSEKARAQYAELLNNRSAGNIRVHNDTHLSVSYTVDGTEKTIIIE